MDKQQATDHVLACLMAGDQPEDIANELSRILKAPTETVSRFVNQVIASHPETLPPPPTPLSGDMPDWIESLSIQAETPQAETSHGFAETDLPPGLQALINQKSVSMDNFTAELGAPTKDREQTSIPGPDLPRQSTFNNPITKAESLNVDLENLGEFVYQQLKKQRRPNDIVEAVCNQTGWHWNKSQRFVARVQTKQHDELQSGKNRIIIAIGIAIILVGLMMALYGTSAIFDYAKLGVSARTNPEVLLNIPPHSAVYALATTVTGIGMIIGGGFGIARVLSNR